MRYAHPARLTKNAVAKAEAALHLLGKDAQSIGGFSSDAISVSVNKPGGWVTFHNALGTIAQHKIAAKFLTEHGAYFGFSYKFPSDPSFTRTVLLYPVTTPDHEADRESDSVVRLKSERFMALHPSTEAV